MPNERDPSRGIGALWWRDLRDRLSGQSARANARWGLLSAPAGQGKLIWIKAGADDDSLLLGAELTRAIRRKRLDVRLAYTFERDTPLIAPYLQGLKGVGVGCGPIDRVGPIARVLARFAPLGVVFAGVTPGRVLGAALQQRGIRNLAIAASAAPGSQVERAFPANPQQCAEWQALGVPVAPSADPLALLVESQVDPNFKTLVAGGREISLFWLDAATEIESYAAAWAGSTLRERGVLFVSGAEGSVPAWPRAARISEWDRTAIAAGTVMIVDDARWLPAIAASVTATHLHSPNRGVFWQALSGGCPVSVTHAQTREFFNEPAGDALQVLDRPQVVLAEWARAAAEVMSARRRGDMLRRLFWQERRRAADSAENLLQAVYDW